MKISILQRIVLICVFVSPPVFANSDLAENNLHFFSQENAEENNSIITDTYSTEIVYINDNGYYRFDQNITGTIKIPPISGASHYTNWGGVSYINYNNGSRLYLNEPPYEPLQKTEISYKPLMLVGSGITGINKREILPGVFSIFKGSHSLPNTQENNAKVVEKHLNSFVSDSGNTNNYIYVNSNNSEYQIAIMNQILDIPNVLKEFGRN